MSANADQVEIGAALAGGHPVALNASPVMRQFGARFVGGETGALTLRFTAPTGSFQGNDVVGGGAVSTVLDLGMALAALSAIEPGSTCSTLSLTVDFLAPLREVDVTVDARVERLGRRAVFTSAVATDDDARRVAIATATHLVH